MKIAFCDDNQFFLFLYEEMIKTFSATISNIEFDEFDSGNALINQYKMAERPYDIIFLDIEMGDLNGIETAKKVREYDENVMIVFVTGHTKYVYESFEVTPFRFLIKPIDFDKLKEVLVAAYNKIKNEDKFLYFTVDRNLIRLACSDIYYLESRKRVLLIHTKSSVYRAYEKLVTYEAPLYQKDFIAIHKSYIINLNHIIEFNVTTLTMVNGDIIPISDFRRKYVKEEHLKYMLRSYKTYVE